MVSLIVCDYDFSGLKDESKRMDGLTFKILGFNNNYAVYYYIKKFEINLNEIQRKIEQEKTEGTQQ
ncbi:hypothetical protein D9V84_06740 [Bacteroidetes/Chlorobi group bacterium Naka2016]|jgi:hypothetical protein|nr:MAG: hypothetical protein D9V84_06740 [Bacteroidetes/Chlorobi group bacterium Naka2016]